MPKKRDYEGDFLCTEEAVRAMFADQRDISGDVEVFDEFDFSERNDRVTLKIEVGQVVYIPGAADIRSTTDSEPETTVALSKEEKILAYIKQNGSVSTQKVMETCNYKSRTGARKLLEKMMNAGLIEKVGESTNTIYKIMK